MPKARRERFFRFKVWPVLALVVATLNGLRIGGLWFVVALYAVIGLVLGIMYFFWRRSP